MSRLRTVGAVLLGAGVGCVVGMMADARAHANARGQSTSTFIAESKRQQALRTGDGQDYRTDDHPARDHAFDHEGFSETLAPGKNQMFDPERWHSEGVGIDVVGPDDVDDNDHEGDDDTPDGPIGNYSGPGEHIWLPRSDLNNGTEDGGDGESDDNQGTSSGHGGDSDGE